MELTHLDHEGRAKMVDVGHKESQHRMAQASGFIQLQPETITLVRQNEIRKGDVLTVAQIAGIQSAKKTCELIPLCHNLIINKVEVNLNVQDDGVQVVSEVRCQGKTGVEMEALTAVSMALLTIYDMCKAVDKSMVISEVKLDHKEKK